jgi:hypothetical protein
MKKITFDIFVIVLLALALIGLSEYGLLEKYVAFALIPILCAYYLGKYAEKKFGADS